MVDDDDVFQLIRQAILFENEELLLDLISADPTNSSLRDDSGRTPLMLAAQNGKLKSLQIVVNLAPDTVDYCSPFTGKTALHLCCEAGESGAVSLLLTAGADPSIADHRGYCALEVSHMAGNSSIAAMLINSIQQEESRVESLHQNLISAMVEGDLQSMEEILAGTKNREKILNGRNGKGALFVACENGRLEGVELLLNEPFRCMNSLVEESSGDSILHASISSQNILLVRLILENFPTLVAKCNKEGSSALHWAVRSRNVDIVELLLRFPYPDYSIIPVDNHTLSYRFAFDLNSGDGECRTALYLSVLQSDVDILNCLLKMTLPMDDNTTKCPFFIDVYCAKGRTPLMIAARNNNLQLISILLSHGADINLPLALLDDNETRAVGSGALLEAAKAKSSQVAEELLANGAVDTDNRALKVASNNNDEELIRLLLSRLAFPDCEMRVNKRNVQVGQMEIGESLLPSYLCPSKGVMVNWSSASLSYILPQWISSAAMSINTRMRTSTLSFAAITRVDVSHNKLEVFPPLLWQLPSLRILNVADNRLTKVEVPSGYLYSSSIDTLILSDNGLTSISCTLLTLLPSLSTLDVSNNDLTSLPDSMWLCPSLKELIASGNSISSLPSIYPISSKMDNENQSIASNKNTHKATTRGIDRRSLWEKELSVSVGYEDEGEEFTFSSHTLATLNLNNNKFRVFPTSLACLAPRLSNLSLSHNLLTTVCAVSALPIHLKSLDVSHNFLTQLFSPNSPMVDCHAEGNGGYVHRERKMSPARESRSRSKSAVRSQRALSMSRRGGEAVGKETCIHRRHNTLPTLKNINISNNRLKNIVVVRGDVIVTPSLSSLDVSSNEIMEVDGDSLSRLSSLSILSLSRNGISSLPPQLGLLTRLWSLSLNECPLSDPLASIVNTEKVKTVDILAHLRSVLEESRAFPHIKVFILGECGVGKSTIGMAIKGEANMIKNNYEGKCARVFQCKMTSKKISSGINVTVWDTNGKAAIRPLLQLSFCRRGVYIIAFRVTGGLESIHSLTNYLLSIQHSAPNASVILVGTHTDELNTNGVDSNLISDLESSIKHRYLSGEGDKQGLPRIVHVLFVSLKKKNDIRAILTSLLRAMEESKMGKDYILSHSVPNSSLCILNGLNEIREDMRKRGKDGVFTQDQLLQHSRETIRKKLGRYVRDENEFNHGLLFARDCGSILMRDDSSFSPLIILDPLLLIDNLSLILSIRTMDRTVGIICLPSLYLIKELSSLSSHLLPLLHKYSIVMYCHSNLLLLPSLLPDEFRLRSHFDSSQVQIEAKSSPSTLSPITKTNWARRGFNLVRLYSMQYIPVGLWPRLISRLTCEERIWRIMSGLVKIDELKWTLWNTGAQLMNGRDEVMAIKEYFPHADTNDIHLHSLHSRIKVDGIWRDIDLSHNRSLLLYIPFVEKSEKEEHRLWTKIISLIVDMVDSLLEDWFPSIGTRFAHSSQGDLLVKRLVLCPSCSPFPLRRQKSKDDSHSYTNHTLADHESLIKNRWQTMNELSSLNTNSISTFSIEECMESARMEDKELECPLHGLVDLASISPDVLLMDMDSSLLLEGPIIKRGRLIGRGAFGFVFRAHIKTNNSLQSMEVAQKMLQPCDPGSCARVSALNEYKGLVSKWERDSLEYSTRAYLSCRHELGVLLRVSHPNTLSLIGMTACPLSLIVEMAPLGSLRSLLTSFRKSGAKLAISTLAETASQTAKALEYLHSNNIVYRDLKSENLLVWRFPPPFCTGEVHVKVGDYGISRLVQPWGEVKGFGGTEGFMAPEIVKWNGEEEYSFKSDVFSYGMLLYELITLKLPFESEDHAKERIVDGGRPLLMPSELLWPCSILDLLSSCWSTSPLNRPSSSQLVTLCTAPEFSRLIDTMVLPSLPLSIISPPLIHIDDESDDVHIWMFSSSAIDIYSCTEFGWVECTSIPMLSSWGNGRLYNRESDESMWTVTESNGIHLIPLNLSNSTLPQTITLPKLDSHPLISTPIPLYPLSQLFLLPSSFSIHLLSRSSHSFSLIESLTSPFEIRCFTIFNNLSNLSNRQLWTGHGEGIITAHFLSSDHRFSFSSSFSHPEGFSLPVSKLISSKDGSLVWSYLDGCSHLFCWSAHKRTLISQLDTCKLQPASETIHTLQMDSSSHISCMCLFERGSSSLLFVGTIEGCLIVLSAHSLQPLSACRPYRRLLSSLHIVDCRAEEETQPGSSTTSSEGAIGWMRERVEKLATPSSILTQSNHLLLTVGTGFRSLVGRFVSQSEINEEIVAALWRIDDWSN